MLGAIIGDMIGSDFEKQEKPNKDFSIFNCNMRMTDDSYLTLAVAKILSKYYPIKLDEKSLSIIKEELAEEFVETWRIHNDVGYGYMFYKWCLLSEQNNKIEPPTNSYGNGSAMRISPVGWVAQSEEEVKVLTNIVTKVTHTHPEAIKGAEAVAMSIYLALHGTSKEEIGERIIQDYYPEIADLNYDELRKEYEFNCSCQKSVPQAIYCFLISNSLEDAIRNAISIGGDTDTVAAMAGSIAEAYYQKDELSEFEDKFIYLEIDRQVEVSLARFYKKIGNHKFDYI